jgi:hypothetical protein
MENKTHYRKVFKSDHLGSADLEDLIEQSKQLVFTIKEVKQELNVSVAGKKGNHNIAYFVEKIKPLVLNAGNSKIIKRFCNGSPFVEDWKNVIIELYIDENVRFGSDTVSGVRVRPTQPKVKQKPVFTSDKIESVKAKGVSIEDIKKIYEISDELIKQYNECTPTKE